MPAKTNTAAKASKVRARTMTADAAPAMAFSAPFETISKSFPKFDGEFKVPQSAREFVARSAASAQEKAAEALENAAGATETAEKALVTLVGNGAKVTRSLLDLAYANFSATLTAFEKVATAKTAAEAAQIQMDFVKDMSADNFNRAREAADLVRASVAEGAKAVQAEVSKVADFSKIAEFSKVADFSKFVPAFGKAA